MSIDDLVSVDIDLAGLELARAPRLARREEIQAVLDATRSGSVAAEIISLGKKVEDAEGQLDLPSREFARLVQKRERWELSRREIVLGSVDGVGIDALSASRST